MTRVRFAPSPTGHLHVGGIRTALFNWLYARKENGSFILRIEDTDTARSTLESEEQIIESMKWCGLNWDEGPDVGGEFGPYKQMQRFEQNIYEKYAARLVKNGNAYYTIYDIDDEKKEIGSFDSLPEEIVKQGNKFTVKFRVPSGITRFEDILKKNMEFENELIDDFIIIKSNGVPVYNFAVVVDDHLMKITHVFRGEDHISNTPRQVMLYESLGFEVPMFMHIPLILGEDRSPLSKRHGGTSAEFFRKEGYLSKGLMNYLALLGWSVDDEFFDPITEIDKFTLDRISNKSVIFDYRKLEWLNAKHIRATTPEQLRILLLEWLRFCSEEYHLKMLSVLEKYGKDFTEEALFICIEKVTTLKQLAYYLEPLIYDDYDYEEQFVDKFLKKENAKAILNASLDKFSLLDEYSIEKIGNLFIELSGELGIGKSKILQTVRGALIGRLVTPGLFETIKLLGRETTISRLKRTIEEVERIV